MTRELIALLVTCVILGATVSAQENKRPGWVPNQDLPPWIAGDPDSSGFADDLPLVQTVPDVNDSLGEILPAYEQAVSSANLEPLKPYLAAAFSGVTLTGIEVDGYDGLRKFFDDMRQLIGPSGAYKVKFQVNGSKPYLNWALVYGNSSEEIVSSDGTRLSFSGLWTAVLTLEGNEWKILRLHSSMDPVQNAFTDYAARQVQIRFGVGGLLAGLLICFVLMRLFRSGTGGASRPA